jgi:hypothetical protein
MSSVGALEAMAGGPHMQRRWLPKPPARKCRLGRGGRAGGGSAGPRGTRRRRLSGAVARAWEGGSAGPRGEGERTGGGQAAAGLPSQAGPRTGEGEKVREGCFGWAARPAGPQEEGEGFSLFSIFLFSSKLHPKILFAKSLNHKQKNMVRHDATTKENPLIGFINSRHRVNSL